MIRGLSSRNSRPDHVFLSRLASGRDTRPNGTKDLMDEAMNGIVDPLRIIKLFNTVGNKRVMI